MNAAATRIDEERVAELAALLPDVEARASLLEVCQPLADRLARRFGGRGESHEDLVQVASIGLLKAVSGFDRSRGDAFMAYALASIVGELRHHVRDRSRTVRVPRGVRANSLEVDYAIDRLCQRLGRSPKISEIAAETGLSAQQVLDAHTSARIAVPASIDELGDEGGMELPAPSDQFAVLTEWMAVAPALEKLPAVQKRILFFRFYRGMSQTEVASELGMSQVHVSRLLNSCLGVLRQTTLP